MPDGADISVKPDELKALEPRLDGLLNAIRNMGKYLRDNQTTPAHFGQTPNGPNAGQSFCQHRDQLGDTVKAERFVEAFKAAVVAAAQGHEANEDALSKSFKNIDGGS